MNLGTCADCVFWDPHPSRAVVTGACRRHAPHPTLDRPPDVDPAVVWPRTWPDDGCGEHQPRTGAAGEHQAGQPGEDH